MKIIIKQLLLFILFIIFINNLQAENQSFTLNQCFQAAVKRSEQLADQQELIIQAEEHFKQARGGLLPSLNLSDTFSSSAPFDKKNGTPTSEQDLRLALNQPLFHGFKSISLYDQTKNFLTAQKEAKQWSLLQLYHDTAQSFYSVLALRKDMEHLTNLITIYDRRIDELNNWVRIGRVRNTDLLSAKTARALIIAQVKQKAGQLANAEALFSFLTGLEAKTPLNDSENLSLEIPSLTECLASMSERPDLSAAKNRSIAADKGIRIAQANHWPWLDLSSGVSLTKPLAANELSWDVQLVISYAIFSGNIISSKVSEARSIARQSDLAYQSLVRKITNDIIIAHQTLQADMAQRDAIEEAVSFAEKNYRQLETDYRLGIAKFTDVLQALSNWEDARRTYDQLNYTIKFDMIQLNMSAGKLRLR